VIKEINGYLVVMILINSFRSGKTFPLILLRKDSLAFLTDPVSGLLGRNTSTTDILNRLALVLGSEKLNSK
jgi:hypothetical protein